MAILAWFVSPFFLTLLGMSATGLLIWFAGPLLHFGTFDPLASVEYRVLAIVALFSIWGVIALISLVLERRHNQQLVDQLATDAEAAPDLTQQASDEELLVLRERFTQALATLKGATGKRKLGGRWVYQLPWYLIIGPPGCGKTTALLNAGLRFPLAEQLGQDAVAGLGGTRNCDWWFTDSAVLIDTAGRYTTQDSDRLVDKTAWQNFLALLKKHRPRRPVNGVLVALSLADLLQQPQVDRDRQALALRQRVQELCQTFHTAMPVYVLLMKADLIAGFNEFFANLNKDGREQVWGMTFPLAQTESAAAPIHAVTTELKLLHSRLEAQLLTRLEQEREPSKRTLLFSFPTQFAALTETLEQFLTEVFTPSRFEIHPMVRGVYFCSGTQTGTPIDRILGAYAANFGLGRQGALPFKGTSKSYFLTRLLRDVVFQESGLAGLDPQLERRQQWLRRGTYAGAALLFSVAALAWTTSYVRNRTLIADTAQQVVNIEQQLATLPSDANDLIGILPLLDAARNLPRGFAHRVDAVEMTESLGLYQGDKLGSQAQRAYLHLLNRVLLPRILRRLEGQIRQASVDPEHLYDALRVYLLLGQADVHTRPNDLAAIKLWIEQDWQHALPTSTTAAQHTALREHLAVLLEHRSAAFSVALNQEVIDSARSILNRAPLTERVYAQLKRDGIGADIPDFTISASAGEYANVLLVRRSGRPLTQGISALYTFDGYHQRFAQVTNRLINAIAAESWVLGDAAQLQPDSPAAAQLFAAVRERYFQDYVTEWKTLLDDIALIPVRDLPHATQVINLLADSAKSPLRLLLVAAAAQTKLDQPPPAETAATAAPEPAAANFGQRVARYFGGDQPTVPTKAEVSGEAPELYVTQRFAWLHDLVRANASGQTQLDQLQTTLSKLELHLTAMAAAMTSGRTLLVAGDTSEIAETKALADKLPAPVRSLVATLAQDSATLEAGGMRAQLNTLWTTEVLPFCREAINDRYPFVKDSARETTLFDFGKLLSSGGMIDTFFKQQLAPLVNTSRGKWQWTDARIGIPTEVLTQFQRAAVIRDTFFSGAAKTPAVEFELRPQRMDAQVIQFMLDLDGQIVDYRQGPPRSQRLQWPMPEGAGRVRLTFTDLTGNGPSATEEGAWAWFRLLDRSALKPTAQPEKFQVTFTLNGLSARFELRAMSVRNPFNLQEVRAFRCPERL
ncbi:type VI secretion protein [Chromatium weissei]|nr:type VI secretion protein [Chromatium weissei]